MNLADDPVFKELVAKVADQAQLNISMALELERNTLLTTQVNTKLDTLVNDTKEVIKVFKGAKASFELLETVSKIAKVLLPIAVVVGWATWMGAAVWSKMKLMLGIA